MIRMS